MLLFRRRLNRTDVEDLLALCIGDSAIGKSDDAYNDENNADDAGWFHCCEFITDGGLGSN